MSGKVKTFPAPVGRMIAERYEATRHRTFHVRSMEDVPDVLRSLRTEGFTGTVTVHVGPGGVPSAVETTEKQALDKD